MPPINIPKCWLGWRVIRVGLSLHPTSTSWLNAVENFFSKMTRQRIRRGVFRSIADLQAAIKAYLAEHNASPKPFVWTKPAEVILAKLDRSPVSSVFRSSPVMASISTVRPWGTDSGAPTGGCVHWPSCCSARSSPRRRSSPTTRRCRCWPPDAAAPRPGGYGLMHATTGRGGARCRLRLPCFQKLPSVCRCGCFGGVFVFSKDGARTCFPR
jgi:hypothetical protein